MKSELESASEILERSCSDDISENEGKGIKRIGRVRKTKAHDIELVHWCAKLTNGRKVFQRKRWRIYVESWKKGEKAST